MYFKTIFWSTKIYCIILIIFFEADPFEWMYNISAGYLRWRILRIIWLLNFLFHMFVSVYQVIYCIQLANYTLFLQFASFLFGSVMGIVCLGIGFFYFNTAEELRTTILSSSLNFNSVGKKFEQNVLKLARTWKLILCGWIFMCAITGIFMLPMFGFELDKYFAVYWIKRNGGSYRNLLLFGYLLAMLCFCYAAGLSYFAITYLGIHIIIQIRIMLKYIEYINIDFERCSGSELYYDENYQKIIYIRLKFCIKRISKLRRCMIICNEKIFWPLIIEAGASITLGFGVIFDLYTNAQNFQDYLRHTSLLIAEALVMCVLCHFGQSIFDQMNDIFESLYRTCWFYWNQRNQKLFLLFIMNVSNPVPLSAADVIVLNYPLILKILKVLYSGAAFLRLMSNFYKT